MSNKDVLNLLIASFSGQQNTLTIPRLYVDMMGGLEGGVFLSQVIYWSDRATRSDGFFYKTYEEWEKEISLSKYKVSKCASILTDLGCLETKLVKANGVPTVHYRLVMPEFQKWIVKFLTMESEKTSQSLTETTTEDIYSGGPAGKTPPIHSGTAYEHPPFNPAEFDRQTAVQNVITQLSSICKETYAPGYKTELEYIAAAEAFLAMGGTGEHIDQFVAAWAGKKIKTYNGRPALKTFLNEIKNFVQPLPASPATGGEAAPSTNGTQVYLHEVAAFIDRKKGFKELSSLAQEAIRAIGEADIRRISAESVRWQVEQFIKGRSS